MADNNDANKSLMNENKTVQRAGDELGETKKKSLASRLYNSETRELLGRDSKAWFQITFFYFIFYALLALFWIGLLYLFHSTLDPKAPTFYNEESTMASRNEISPGMGFRPHKDPESALIYANINDADENVRLLDLYLNEHQELKETPFKGAHEQEVVFNYEDLIDDTPCSRANSYGYNTASPCVLIKMNKIYGWLPRLAPETPYNLTGLDEQRFFVYVACNGAQSADQDNIGEMDYYSGYPNSEIGGLEFKYFPYKNQANYLQPLVFVHFKSISPNTLVNIECQAYAKNIDNERVKSRGMTKFRLYVDTVEKEGESEEL